MATKEKQMDLFLHDRENNPTSEDVLHRPKTQKDLKAQTIRIFDMLMRGKTLTTWQMFVIHKIMSPPRRMSDLKLNGYKFSKKEVKDSRTVVYFMTQDQIDYNRELKRQRSA